MASIVIISTPETYSLSSMSVVAHLNLFMRVKDHFSGWSTVALGTIAGAAGLANPMLLRLGMIAGVRLLSPRGLVDSIRPVALMCIVSVLIYCAVVVTVWDFDSFQFSPEYANDWASLGHFL